MSFEIDVENIKCGGCAGSIVSGLKALDGVAAVDVDVEHGRVTVDADNALRPRVSEKLKQLGYPKVGTTAGLAAAKAKAKSFVSCAVGRFGESSSE